ncbi:MAG: BPSS1780 family membrane protein [Rhodocyclaceae bacterium]|nr:BPSS1780 family membrane protein [Rhodocyclaceae bacterium]
MIARKLPAARGIFWLLAGLRLFRANPPLIAAATVIYLLVVQVVALLPVIGPVLLPLMLPAATLIVGNVCRLVDARAALSRATLVHGLAGNGPAMLRLGGLQLAGAVLLLLVNVLLAGGEDPFVNILEPGDETPPSLWPLARLLLTATPLILAFWFAPFLTGWAQVAPVKSLFFSTVASLRNWAAMAVFSLSALILAGVLPALILIFVGQAFGVALNAVFIALRLLLVFFIAPVLSAAVYVSYRDIFQVGDDVVR